MTEQKLCVTDFKGEVLFSKEYINHDGFDEDGPKSNLWSLLFIVKEDNKFIFYEYYRDYYFYIQKKDDDEYELIHKEEFTKKTFDLYQRYSGQYFKIEDIEKCNNEELKEYVKSLS